MGFQNSATGSDLVFYAARSYSLIESAEHSPTLDPFLGKVGDCVVGWRQGRAAD